jgi:hypothetical protein
MWDLLQPKLPRGLESSHVKDYINLLVCPPLCFGTIFNALYIPHLLWSKWNSSNLDNFLHRSYEKLMSCQRQLLFVARHKADNKSKYYSPITSNRMADYVFHLLRHENVVLIVHVMYFIVETYIYLQKANERLKQGQKLMFALKRL